MILPSVWSWSFLFYFLKRFSNPITAIVLKSTVFLQRAKCCRHSRKTLHFLALLFQQKTQQKNCSSHNQSMSYQSQQYDIYSILLKTNIVLLQKKQICMWKNIAKNERLTWEIILMETTNAKHKLYENLSYLF